MSRESAEAVFDALGEPVRRRILELLREGPLPVGRLADRLPVGRPAVSKHLQVLSRAGLVERESRGTRNLYAVAPHGLVPAQQWLLATWDTVLDEYAAAVRAAKPIKSPKPAKPAKPTRAAARRSDSKGA